MGRRPNPERKPELLQAVVDDLARRGVADVSLRPLAARLGVSTYALTYHFGSKEQLLAEALASVEGEQVDLVRGWAAQPGASTATLVERYWTWVCRPENLARVRLVFEALTVPRTAELLTPEFRRRLMVAWVELLAGALRRSGLAEQRATAEATGAAAALAGMVLDLLATGDQARLRLAVRALAHRLAALTSSATGDPHGVAD